MVWSRLFIIFSIEVNDHRITSFMNRKLTSFSRSSIRIFFGNYPWNLAEFQLWFLDSTKFQKTYGNFILELHKKSIQEYTCLAVSISRSSVLRKIPTVFPSNYFAECFSTDSFTTLLILKEKYEWGFQITFLWWFEDKIHSKNSFGR